MGNCDKKNENLPAFSLRRRAPGRHEEAILRKLLTNTRLPHSLCSLAMTGVRRRNEKQANNFLTGFTLIELMVVVVIIGILAAIAIPNFIAMRNRAKEASVKAAMHSIQLALQCYATFTNGAYPSSGDISGNTLFLKQFIGGTPPNDPYCNLTYAFASYGGNKCSQADFVSLNDPNPLTSCNTLVTAANMPGEILYITDDENRPANNQWAMAGQGNATISTGSWIKLNNTIFCDHN